MIRDHRQPAPWRDRAPKQKPECRCCWVCGKVGGQGFTHALRFAGYRVRDGEMGYAHNFCMVRAQRQHTRHTLQCADQVLADAQSSPSIITDDTWPRHPDGRRMKIGEMTNAQQIAVARGAVARLTPEFAAQGVALEFKGDA